MTGCLIQVSLAVDVSVLDWNIRHAIGPNGPNSSAQPFVSKVLNYLKPDVWTIQELGGNNSGYAPVTGQIALTNFVNNNLSYLGHNGNAPVLGTDYFVYVGQASDGFIGNAIVSRFPILSTQTYGDGLRGLVRATLDVPGAIDLGVFTTHLKAFNDTPSAYDRQAEANTSSGNIANWKIANSGNTSILTGDFNETEDPDNADNWSDGSIGDPISNGFNTLTYHPVTTMKGAGFNDGVPRSANNDKDTISSSNPTKRFDYNLFSNDGKISYLDGTVFNTAAFPFGQQPPGFGISDSQLASDHLPVFARFNISNPVPEPTAIAILGAGLTGLVTRRKRRKATH